LSFQFNETQKLIPLIIFIFFSFFSTNAKLAMGDSLNKYLWEHRIVLIFSKNKNNSMFVEQKQQFSNLNAETQERDLIFLDIFNNSNSKHKHLKNKYNPESSNFKILLIGKDGEIKLQSLKVITHDKIFSLIDSMPMRQMEIQKRAND
tara:strand:- start:8821 stop:9264 length:444 start_codon:yes stop_codon:yes gene_type:complete